MDMWWVMCWTEKNEAGAFCIGPYFSVEQCEADIKWTNCTHVHQFSKGVPPASFGVSMGQSSLVDPDQLEDFYKFWETRDLIDEMVKDSNGMVDSLWAMDTVRSMAN